MSRSIPEESCARRLIAYSFLVVYANDDVIDADELKMLEKIALEDGKVDDEERRVLSNIFRRVEKDQLTESVWNEISRFREEHGIT